jgi:hypothetical protein
VTFALIVQHIGTYEFKRISRFRNSRARQLFNHTEKHPGKKFVQAWDRCYEFLKIFAEKFSEKMAFLTQNKAKLCKILIITLVFEKRPIFRRKLSQIAENCDHNNIDPWFTPATKNGPFLSPSKKRYEHS